MSSKITYLQRLRHWLGRTPVGLTLTFSLIFQVILPASTAASPQFDSGEAVPVSVQPSEGYCPQNFHGQIQRIIDQPTFQTAEWGVVAETLSGQVLFHRNRDRLLIPASNVKLLTTAAALQTFGSWDTALQTWVGIVNRESNNSSADALLAHLGGPGQVQMALSSLGIDPLSYRQVDGSGLSRYNAVQPSTLVTVLRSMWSAPGGEVFYRSLPVAGQSGTLRRRFRDTPLQGQVRAKTGTLRGVRALSGYLSHPDYGPIVFSIIVNQPGQSGDRMLQAIDDVVFELSHLTLCESPEF
ncbi:MAG: D-alanyl-D-alanine carboxypeptidase [Elainellaceae cyanobacterium]